MCFSKSILAKILIPVFVITIVLVAVIVTVTTRTFSHFAQENFTKEIHTVAHNVQNDVHILEIMASDQVNGLAGNRDMIAAIKEGNREKVQDIISKFESKRKCTFFTALDPECKVIFRSSRPEQSGDLLNNMRCANEVLTKKKPCVYFESTTNLPLAIRAASPILDENGNLIGIMTGGFRVDTEEWVDEVQKRYNVECTTFLGEERIATTIRKLDSNERAVGTKLNNPKIYDPVFNERKMVFGETMVVGRLMKVFYNPIFNEGDSEVMGIFFAGIPMERQAAQIRQNVWYDILITVIGLIIFGFILFWVIQAIVQPIQTITKAAKELADGSLEVDFKVHAKDETAVLADAFHKLAESLHAKTDVALAIANGDLTVWVPLRSEHDSLGMSLIKMRYGLYDSIKGLTALVTSIFEEASSLSHVNQSLVNNTTHSAEQLKDVSLSIRSLHSQTVHNAENAGNAENLTKSARNGSNDSKEKMGRMVQAMDAITKSSGEIKNIIRVIDDIAFQTNLLALNAAVEAARAGQHGKGFAVVAEEVRNLASRSAKAARETAGLIEESIQHVGSGSGVAHETANSLNVITDQVEQISKIVSSISEESDQQAKHLGEMTSTVSQISATADDNMQSVTKVTDVVNSVTQTARGLDEIVGHFKSNEGGKVMLEEKTYPGYIPPKGTFAQNRRGS